MDEIVIWRPLLRDALAALAAPPDIQIRFNGAVGCISCDLLEDFDHARIVTLANAKLSQTQLESLDRLDAEIQGMTPPDIECGDNEVIRRPAWQSLRVLAHDALSSFGWEHAKIQPFIEIKPGLWHRPPSED